MWRTMNSTEHELVAKNNLVVAKVLAAVVVLVQLCDPPQDVLVGILTIVTMMFSTISTFAWMSR